MWEEVFQWSSEIKFMTAVNLTQYAKYALLS